MPSNHSNGRHGSAIFGSIVHACTKVGPEAGLKAVRGVMKRGFHYAIDLSPGSYRTKFGARTLSNGFKTSKKPPFLAIFMFLGIGR